MALDHTDVNRTCPACGSKDANSVSAYSPKPWDVVSCDPCQFVFLRNPPAYEALEEDFAWEKTYEAKKSASNGSTPFSPMARKIRNGLGMYRDKTPQFRKWFNDGLVLDIGCGWGQRIKSPMTPFGIELSVEMHSKADAWMRQQGGYCLHGPGAEAIWDFPAEHFDGVVMFSYLEHESAVMKVLDGAYRALKPSGGVFIRVPNYASFNRRVIGPKWCGFRYPDHVNYFTLQSLSDVAARAGFTTHLVNKFSLPVDDNITVLLRKTNS
ncbi:Methyltransferase domain protein [Phaeobacter sp. CECT 5382]|uniref:class I SAM-dependent methyltransferase n=1 Tax=Phaeobacter sp. CECT 5382 TaxID=1712645 RepID=UPI0006DBD19C|nr:class I SAM-dependent methyltransferase [Phaeobacter sp. CECT 5382]CUH87799.1 Methyltransferase domain protein [Phaeobacter sp. CECT 5382]